MSITRYRARGAVRWQLDEWVYLNGVRTRLRERGFESKEKAEDWLSRQRKGETIAPIETIGLTVRACWETYQPVCERDCRAYSTDSGRAKHLLRLLGTRDARGLSVLDVDAYRARRLKEKTVRDKPPSPATLDREVELLRRAIAYALGEQPLSRVKLLRKPNVRKRVVVETDFARLHAAAESWLRPIILLAFDTGMRQREVLDLRWSAVDLESASVRLWPDETKSEVARLVVLTERCLLALRSQRATSRTPFVFANPNTGKPFRDIRKSFHSACVSSGLRGLWFHDLRRSFVTKARKLGVSESVVMRMSGHKTRAVFDRYNVVDESDLRLAAAKLGQSLGQRLTSRGG